MEIVAMNTALVEQEMNKLAVTDPVVSKPKETSVVAADDNKSNGNDHHQDNIASETERLGENAVPAEPQSNKKRYNRKRIEKINNRIQVSNVKKPFFFYLNLAKWQLKKNSYVELSALGMAIPTAILISEILKRNGHAIEKKLMTFLVNSKEEENGHLVQKSKILIALEKADKHIKTVAAVKVSVNVADKEI